MAKTDRKKYKENMKYIIKNIKECYESALDLCGENDEITNEAKQLYEKVSTRPLIECEKDIEKHFELVYESVEGEIEKYYGVETNQLFNKIKFIGVNDVISVRT